MVAHVVLGNLEKGSKPNMEHLMQTCISEEHSDLIQEIASSHASTMEKEFCSLLNWPETFRRNPSLQFLLTGLMNWPETFRRSPSLQFLLTGLMNWPETSRRSPSLQFLLTGLIKWAETFRRSPSLLFLFDGVDELARDLQKSLVAVPF